MAIFSLADATKDIKLGEATILGSNAVPAYRNLPSVQNLGSGHDIAYFDTLDGRYKIPPTGWSE